MTFQQKNAIAAITTMIVLFTIFFITVFAMHSAGSFEGPEGLQLLGKSVVLLIFVSIITIIVTTILFNIAHSVITKDPSPAFTVDERDRVIEFHGLRAGSITTGIFFCIAMAALALGQGVFWVLILTVFAFAFGSVVDSFVKIRLYRKGFSG